MLPILLPIVYLLVISLGVAMLFGLNPFTRLEIVQSPRLQNRYLMAYVYGLMFGPMTLPCTGPIILSAFSLGSGFADVADGLIYFLFFGLGFGWPLVVLPILALPLQRQIVSVLATNKAVLERASGILLIAVGLFGFLTELLPQMVNSFELGLAGQIVYWVVMLIVAIVVGVWTYQQQHAHDTIDSEPAITSV